MIHNDDRGCVREKGRIGDAASVEFGGTLSYSKMTVEKSHVRAGPALIQVKKDIAGIDGVSSWHDAWVYFSNLDE